MTDRLRIGVIGHVEHVTLGRVPLPPGPGDIAHLDGPVWFPGGGGGITFFQLTRSDAEIHLFTAVGNDEAGAQVRRQLERSGAVIHAADRQAPHTRDVVMIDDRGERTIVVVGEPLHPRADDDLPWEVLADLDAVYFTAQDPELLRRARQARTLVATARRKAAIAASGVALDVAVGSLADPRERSARRDYDPPPATVVMTEGERGGLVETATGSQRFAAPAVANVVGGAYGAGDSFAGALVFFVASGLVPHDAAQQAAAYGAAVLTSLNPLDAQKQLPPRP